MRAEWGNTSIDNAQHLLSVSSYFTQLPREASCTESFLYLLHLLSSRDTQNVRAGWALEIISFQTIISQKGFWYSDQLCSVQSTATDTHFSAVPHPLHPLRDILDHVEGNRCRDMESLNGDRKFNLSERELGINLDLNQEKHAPKPFSNKPIAKGNHLQQKKMLSSMN